MTFQKRLIHDNEEVLLESHPHWWPLIGPSLAAIVTIGGSAAIFVMWSSAPKWFGWVLLGAVVVVASYFLSRFIQWHSTDLVVTTMRVIYRRGVVSRSGREIPISSVQDVSFVQSLAERIVGKGQLSVQSVGGRGEAPFVNVHHPAVVQGLINRTIEESRRHAPARLAGGGQVGVAEELEHLGALHSRGVITDGEFARMKGEVIAGAEERDGDDEWDGSD